MKLLTRNTDYAVRAICTIASQDGRTVSAAEIVGELKMPKQFMRKILQSLNKAGIVRSVKGAGGGFALAHDPYRITLADVIEVFQGPLSINECVFKKRACPNIKDCPLRARITSIEDHVERELRATSIGSLLNKDN